MIDEKNSVIYKLRQQARSIGLRPRTKDAVDFFLKTVRRLRTPIRKSPGFAKDTSLIPRSNIRPGMFMYYEYDPVTERLPYWDKFPLTLIIAVWQENGKVYFDGLNFHYLPPFMRFALMIRLLEFKSNNPNLKNTKVNINYNMIKDVGNLNEFKPAYKKYLLGQVKSNFYQVELRHLDIAMSLPLANWQGASESTVWSDTIANALGG